MSQYECWWCGKSYYSDTNRTGFCSERCRSEGGGLREARASVQAESARKEKERQEQERLRNLPEEVARRKIESEKHRNKREWEDAERGLFLPSILLAVVMTIMFMRTIFPSLLPGLAQFVFMGGGGTRTLFPSTVPDWIVTVVFYAIPISPIGWAAWLFFPLAVGLNQLLLQVIIYSYRKLLNN